MIQIGIGLSLTGAVSTGGGGPSPPSYDPAATAYFDAMTVQPNATRKGLINDLITGLKADGVWALLDWLNLAAAHDEQAARINMINPAQIATSHGTVSFTVDRGATSDGSTGYWDTGVSPATGTPHYTQNNCHAGVWLGTDLSGVQVDIGNARMFIRARNGTAMQGNFQGGFAHSGSGTLPGPTSIGHSAFSRTASTTTEIYKDGAGIATNATASIEVISNTITLMANSGSSHSPRRHQAGHWGASLTPAQMAALYGRFNTYMTAIGAV